MIPEHRNKSLGLFLVIALCGAVFFLAGEHGWNEYVRGASRDVGVTVPASSDIRQIHYRWRHDNGGEVKAELLFATTSNPGAFDYAYAIAIDSSSVYVAGTYDSNDDPTIERYSISDLSFIATTSTVSCFGLFYGLAVDSSSLYAVGDDCGDWIVQKRSLGSLVVQFSTTSNPGANESANAVTVDSSFMYIVGSSSTVDWRIEKRSLADGTLLFATTSNPGTTDVANAIAIDSSSMYVAGTQSGVDWRIEKRALADGALLFATTSNPGAIDAARAIAIDSSSMYVVGCQGNASNDWRIERRSLSDGTLIYATTSASDGIDCAYDIAIDHTSMHVVGEWGEIFFTNGVWRIEKRDLFDGTLLYATTTSNIGSDNTAQAIAVDSSSAYIAGWEQPSGSSNWRIEKRTLGTDIVGTFAALEDISYSFAKQFIKRLRVEISNEGGTTSTQQYRIEYATSTNGPWTEVGSSTAHFVMGRSNFVAENERTLNIAGLTDENTTFAPGYFKVSSTTAPSLDLSSTNFTELEYSILATSTAIQGQTYYFRLTNNGTSLDTYSIYASATIASDFEITNVVVNNGSAITLTPNTTTSISINYTVSGGPGCGPVFYGGYVTTTLYRSGVSSTCGTANSYTVTESSLYCYKVTTSTHNCPNSTSTASANATTTLDLYYFAQATDASSSFSSENWQAIVYARDGQGGIETATTSASGVELNTLLAIEPTPTSSLNYGTLSAGQNTSSTNQTAGVKNAGNSSSSLRISGTAMTSGANSIATSSQHYATGTFTYGGNEQQLQESATNVSGFTIARPPLTSWATTTPLPSALREHSALAYNHYLYVVGGDPATGTETSTVFFAPLSPSGTVGTWETTTPLPSAINNLKLAAAYGNYLYVAGGDPASATETTTVIFALINTTGSLGTWATTTPLPRPLEEHTVLANNGYLYILGGDPDTETETSTVLFAPINATGSIGSWVATTPLPSPSLSTNHAATIWGSYLYVVGGGVGGGAETTTIIFAPINSTGSIGTWQASTPYPVAITEASAIADNEFLYVIGGDPWYAAEASSTYIAPIHANGTLGFFSASALLPRPLSLHASAVWNGYLYAVGGDPDIELQTSTVLYAPLASRNTYWGFSSPTSTPAGSYVSTVTFTGVFSP